MNLIFFKLPAPTLNLAITRRSQTGEECRAAAFVRDGGTFWLVEQPRTTSTAGLIPASWSEKFAINRKRSPMIHTDPVRISDTNANGIRVNFLPGSTVPEGHVVLATLDKAGLIPISEARPADAEDDGNTSVVQSILNGKWKRKNNPNQTNEISCVDGNFDNGWMTLQTFNPLESGVTCRLSDGTVFVGTWNEECLRIRVSLHLSTNVSMPLVSPVAWLGAWPQVPRLPKPPLDLAR